MRQTPSKMRMNDMVTIDIIVFEIVEGPPPPRIVNFLKYLGSDIGYEPADRTCIPPQNCRGWVHFFRIGV